MGYYNSKGRGKYANPSTTGEIDTKKKGWNPSWKKQAPIVKVGRKPIANPSSQQMAIFDEIVSGTDNLLIQARAGVGKTTVIVESVYRLLDAKPSRKILVLAYNNRIWREVDARVPENVDCKTLHKLGFAVIKNNSPVKVELDTTGEKAERIAVALVGAEDEKAETRYMLAKATSLAKNYLAKTKEEVIEIIARHDIEVGKFLTEDEFAGNVLKMMDTMLAQPTIIDFDDMGGYLPFKKGMSVPKYDDVFIDEAQDTNDARFELALMAVRPGGRVILVADDRQRLYSFTGVRKDGLERMKSRLNAKTMPLTKTFRCGKAIVEIAKTIVPDYEAADTNPEGEVSYCSEDELLMQAKPGCFILSRKNAPLIGICMALVKRRVPCMIQGKDLGKGLKYTIKRSEAKTVDSFLTWLDEYRAERLEWLAKRKRDTSEFTDKYEVLLALCEGAKTLDEVYRNIDTLFGEVDGDDTKTVCCSTVHKSKGLERDEVFLLTDTFEVKNADVEDEANVMYVACTRARLRLVYVEKGGLVKRSEEAAAKETDEA